MSISPEIIENIFTVVGALAIAILMHKFAIDMRGKPVEE
jgi:hypothetical protein